MSSGHLAGTFAVTGSNSTWKRCSRSQPASAASSLAVNADAFPSVGNSPLSSYSTFALPGAAL